MNELRKFFDANAEGKLLTKWEHYFEIYERHFARYRNQELVLLEIGVYHGGSLDMWREYFGAKCKIIGVDVNPSCQTLATDHIDIIIGDQADKAFLSELTQQIPPVDILIDDGGHTMAQQINTFEVLFPHVKADGIYLCEDLHTSYWSSFDAGYQAANSYIEYSKNFIDQLQDPDSDLAKQAHSLHFYDSMLVIEKQTRHEPVLATSTSTDPAVVKFLQP